MDPSRPAVRFLVHGAERSGPPLHVLRLLRHWSVRPPAFRPQVVLARGGELEGAFSALAPTTVAGLGRRSPESAVARALAAAGHRDAGEELRRRATRLRCRGLRPALTVVNGATAPTAELLRALRPEGDVVLVAHELSTGWFGNIDEADRRLLLGRCAHVAAVSATVADYLVEVGFRRDAVTVIPPAVDLPDPPPRRRGGPGRSVVVGGAGVTDWRKAPELWLRVAAEARELAADLDVRFVWFGGHRPDERAGWPLLHEVRHLGLEGAVRFLGEVADPGPVLAGLDVFVSTAREDAAPLVCAEAAAAGVPVVTFDGGGAAELARDGRCGVVVPYPREEELAASVVRLARDPQLRERLGAAGSRHVAGTQSTPVVAERTEAWLVGALG